MAKITQRELKKRLGKGWEVETIEKAKPKAKPKKLLKDQIAEQMIDSGRKTQETINQLADTIRATFEQQTEVTDNLDKRITEVGDRKITVEMPPAKEGKKKKWKFHVQRDHRGFIENIIAEEL
jgi:hypothetical protein